MALIYILSHDFESSFETFRKQQLQFGMFSTIFSVNIDTLPASMQIYVMYGF